MPKSSHKIGRKGFLAVASAVAGAALFSRGGANAATEDAPVATDKTAKPKQFSLIRKEMRAVPRTDRGERA